MAGEVTALLWMDEDELRHTCRVLMATLIYAQRKQDELIGMVQEAAADGYKIGYADAVADRALRISQKVAVGVEEGVVLH